MASGMFESGRVALLSGGIDWLNDGISAVLLDLSLYNPDLAQDQSLDDIPEAAIISETVISGKWLDGATCRADNAVFVNVPDTEERTASAVVLFKENEVATECTLFSIYDEAPEFPAEPDGTDIVVIWDTGANGIVRLF